MKFLPLVVALALIPATVAFADEKRPDHFEGEASPTLDAAIENLSVYNAKLQAIIGKSNLTATDMAEIHQLTYTIEVALARLNEEVETMQEQVEVVHLSSERMEFDQVQETGTNYLENIAKIAPPKQ
ncbi:hypothetical protein CWE22_01735 [Pseudidiomarina aestuarii]|uniref:Uncharacterized protein n=1 Tax=Pseudidiomarina aestuarii TaxID=624146 RepID=A0A7Z7ETE6_9GAMM|nr:DUF6746 family protein [Pseudidiomarina aestuarii]RUO40945.1 hypothetical protein CWE22_01735 [Pseudidiomarina aestuarii]